MKLLFAIQFVSAFRGETAYWTCTPNRTCEIVLNLENGAPKRIIQLNKLTICNHLKRGHISCNSSLFHNYELVIQRHVQSGMSIDFVQ
jgi:hypothetical protein